MAEEAWRADAACRGQTDLFFPAAPVTNLPVRHQREALAAALALCRRCPALRPCREWAIRTGQTSTVAGGLVPGELRLKVRSV